MVVDRKRSKIVNVALDALSHGSVARATDRRFLMSVLEGAKRHYAPNAMRNKDVAVENRLLMFGLRHLKHEEAFGPYVPDKSGADALMRDVEFLDDADAHIRQMQAVEEEFAPALAEYRKRTRAVLGVDRSMMLDRPYDERAAALAAGFSENYTSDIHNDGVNHMKGAAQIRADEEAGNASETIAWTCPARNRLDRSTGFALGCGIILPFRKARGRTPSPFSIGQGKYWHGTLRSNGNSIEDPVIGTVILNKPLSNDVLADEVVTFREQLDRRVAQKLNPYSGDVMSSAP